MKKPILFFVMISFLSIISNAQSPEFAWAKNAIGSGNDEGKSICVDASGNSYITGCFSSDTITFGAITLIKTGIYNIFVAKYDASGNVIWAKRCNISGEGRGSSISVDASGNSYITGYFTSSTITFDTITLINNDTTGNSFDVLIAKYDASGNLIWAKSAGGSDSDMSNSISVDANGNSYITGYFYSSTITFNTTTLINNNYGKDDIFITKYDASGNVIWARRYGGSGNDGGNSISVDASGNFYLTGSFTSYTITFDTFSLINNSSEYYDFFIAKYDASGNVLWAESASGSVDDEGLDISVDANGNSFITGYFYSSTITIDTTTLTNNGMGDIFIAKYDALGNFLWAKSAGGSSYDAGYGINVDANGNSYIIGEFNSHTIVFGTTTLTNNIGCNIFIAKYDPSGNVLWAKSADDNHVIAEGDGISVDATGNSYIIGSFNSQTIGFGITTLINNNSGSNDIFITKLNSVAGIAEITNYLNDVSIFPNPANSEIRVNCNQYSANSIEIYNMLGEKINTTVNNKPQSTNDIDVSSFLSGVYIVKVNIEKGVTVKMFIKE